MVFVLFCLLCYEWVHTNSNVRTHDEEQKYRVNHDCISSVIGACDGRNVSIPCIRVHLFRYFGRLMCRAVPCVLYFLFIFFVTPIEHKKSTQAKFPSDVFERSLNVLINCFYLQKRETVTFGSYAKFNRKLNLSHLITSVFSDKIVIDASNLMILTRVCKYRNIHSHSQSSNKS